MRITKLFTKTVPFAPKDEVTVNAQLLIRAGYVNKLMAGVYSYLPLGLRVLNNISTIVREEMDTIGGQELQMPALHPSEIWKQSGGWDNIDVLFKLQSRTEKEYALGQSEEEVVTPIAKEYVKSYRDLPLALYQIAAKFRDELRAKSGILRGREFPMKDMYSWHENQEDFDRFYAIVKQAYLRIYERCGLVAKVTEASGGSFSKKISYEFMVLTDAGEDDILYCEECVYCVNTEIAKTKENDQCPQCKKGKLKKARASEVGNVFDLGTRYPEAFDFKILNEKGELFYPVMGCFGIGISRLMGVIVEKHADEKGLVWPESVAPFQVHLIGLDMRDSAIREKAEKTYEALKKHGISVLFDDREEAQAGTKFSDADLMGMPVRLVVSKRTGEMIEVKDRIEKEASTMSIDDLLKRYAK